MTIIGTVILFNEETYATTFLCENCWFNKSKIGKKYSSVYPIPLKVGDKIGIKLVCLVL